MKQVRLSIICVNETYSKVRIGKHLFDNFPMKNGLKQGDALSSLLFNVALEYPIRKAQENQVALKLNGTHQLLFCVDDVDLLGDNMNTIKKNTETLTDARKEVGLEANADKTKHKLLSHHQNARQNHNIHRYFDNVTQFKHLRMRVINQKLIQEEIKSD
jgi:hypothetical protein